MFENNREGKNMIMGDNKKKIGTIDGSLKCCFTSGNWNISFGRWNCKMVDGSEFCMKDESVFWGQ